MCLKLYLISSKNKLSNFRLGEALTSKIPTSQVYSKHRDCQSMNLKRPLRIIIHLRGLMQKKSGNRIKFHY